MAGPAMKGKAGREWREGNGCLVWLRLPSLCSTQKNNRSFRGHWAHGISCCAGPHVAHTLGWAAGAINAAAGVDETTRRDARPEAAELLGAPCRCAAFLPRFVRCIPIASTRPPTGACSPSDPFAIAWCSIALSSRGLCECERSLNQAAAPANFQWTDSSRFSVCVRPSKLLVPNPHVPVSALLDD